MAAPLEMDATPVVWPLRTAAGCLLFASAAVAAMLVSDPAETRLAFVTPPAPTMEERAGFQMLAAADEATNLEPPIVALDPPTTPRVAEAPPLDRIASRDLDGLRLGAGEPPVGKPRVARNVVEPLPQTPADRRVPDPFEMQPPFVDPPTDEEPPQVASALTPSPSVQVEKTPQLVGGYFTREVVRRPAESGFALFGSLPLIGGIPVAAEEIIETRESFLLLSPEDAEEMLRRHAAATLSTFGQ